MNWVGILPIHGGLGLLGLSWIFYRRAAARARAAVGWPTAEGEVLESRVEEKEGHSDGSRYVHYVPVLRYAYAVDGRTFRGDRLSFTWSWGQIVKREHAEAMLAAYPLGSRPKVSYNPADPSDSVLEARAPKDEWRAIAFFGLLFIGVGIYVLAGGQ